MHETMKDIVTLSELTMSENRLQYKLNPGMIPFEERLFAVSTPTRNRTQIERIEAARFIH